MYIPPYPSSSHARASRRTWRVGRKVTDWWKRMSATSAGAGRERCAPDGRRGPEDDRDVLGAVDEVRLQPLHLAVEAHVGHAVEEPVEHHHDLHAGQVGAETEVRPAPRQTD